MTIEANTGDGSAQKTIWGLFTVPKKAWPWVSLVVIQILLPEASFLGHISGIIIGYACS